MPVRKLLIVVAIVAALAIGLLAGHQLAKMGSTDSSGTPGTTSSFSLDDIYDRLATGAPGAQGTFTEPTTGTGTGTMHTIDEIMALIPDRKWSFTGAEGERTLIIPDGIYSGTSTATIVDSDLSEENIRIGYFTIFGVWGENEACVTCAGTPSPQGRWCDNGNGTITDMTTGLTWLQDASWGGQYPWRNDTTDWPDMYTDARGRPGELSPPDGTAANYWRLPTHSELQDLYLSPEGVRVSSPYFFTGLQPAIYWTSSSTSGVAWAYGADFGQPVQPVILDYNKAELHYVWPVRGPRR
ncbi:DUF1566 domain-containing protein [Candidatus Bipolaricaulota bacterium]